VVRAAAGVTPSATVMRAHGDAIVSAVFLTNEPVLLTTGCDNAIKVTLFDVPWLKFKRCGFSTRRTGPRASFALAKVTRTPRRSAPPFFCLKRRILFYGDTNVILSAVGHSARPPVDPSVARQILPLIRRGAGPPRAGALRRLQARAAGGRGEPDGSSV
jgi:hypothetical protein